MADVRACLQPSPEQRSTKFTPRSSSVTYTMSQNMAVAINCVLELIAVAHATSLVIICGGDELSSDKWLRR